MLVKYMTGVCHKIMLLLRKKEKQTMKKLFNKIFRKKVTKKNKTLTIINENRKSQLRFNFFLANKNERQDSCLSKYFDNLSGYNVTERNVYLKTF